MKNIDLFSLLLFLIFIIKIVHSENSLHSGRCGKGIGSCKKDECCSKYGWCGKSNKHCMIEEGCQSKFGKCNSNADNTNKSNDKEVSKNGKCGKGVGSCKKDECCSKYGWCGKTNDHCEISKGCQSEFGKCKSNTTTITTTSTKPNTSTQTPSNGKCGKEYGSCKKGECCSKYGWCGKTDDYCDISKGCQSEFGVCHDKDDPATNNPTSSNPTPANPTSTNPTPDIPTPDVPTPDNPVNNSTDISNPDFDFSFLKLENNKKNMLYSPLSIRFGLNMLKKGADGNTYDEINKVIGNTELRKYASIDKTLSLANGIFIKDEFYKYVKQSYINTLKEKYDAEIIQDEFKDAQNANKWIEDKTLGIIKEMLKDGSVQNSVMIIINAFAIDMAWYHYFDCMGTHGKTFYLDDGQKMEATMMSNYARSSYVSYYIDDDITVLTMSLENYNGTQLEFMAIMPNENLSTFIENVSKEQIIQIDKKLKLSSDEKYGVIIRIPKFKFDYDLKFKEDLINLGIKDTFDDNNADFSKMAKIELYVSEAFHKADIEFSEDGIKAAAVTVFEMEVMEGPPDGEEIHPIEIIINKPFMFIIRDREAKDIWFTGTVYKPNSWENDEEMYIPIPIDDY